MMHTTLTDPLTFFITGAPGVDVAAIGAFIDGCADAFVLQSPHSHSMSEPHDWGKTQRHWDGLCCRECGGRQAIKDVLSIYPRFIVPVTEAHYHLGGYAETYRGDVLGVRLLVAHVTLVDFWLCVTGTPDDLLEQELTGLAHVAYGITLAEAAFKADPLAALNEAVAGRFKVIT